MAIGHRGVIVPVVYGVNFELAAGEALGIVGSSGAGKSTLARDSWELGPDEPNSNLDAEGNAAVSNPVTGARERGAIVVIVAHRPSAWLV